MTTDGSALIAVHPPGALHARPRLFHALAKAFPVRFTPFTPGDGSAVDGLIAIVDDPASTDIPDAGVSAFVVGHSSPREAPFEDVLLADSPRVDQRVRGVTLRDRIVGGRLDSAAEPLATSGAGAVWARSGAGSPVDRVRCVLPELEPGQVLYALLSQRAIAMVALTQFLRAVSSPVAWQPPPLRASFVFDDPNLHWRSYGFIDYHELVAHADEHGYHAAMATIPIDATWSHRATASLFAGRPDRLSLVVHGNDHVKNELLMPRDDRTALAIAAQAVCRIERFERRAGVRVERVMMPPHGLCSGHMARALSAVGFDALCAIHPAPWTEERPSTPPLVAWDPAGFIGGCPVIPRDALTSTVADLALRAFLDHPLVIYGHHQDVADGLEPLADAAARINRLGDVRWSSVGEIAMSNQVHRVAGDHLAVRPYSRRLRISVPDQVRTISVEPPDPVGTGLELAGWSAGAGAVVAFGTTAEVAPGTVEIRLHGSGDVDPARVQAPPRRPWPKLRRAVTELRDRAVALAPR